MVSLGNILDKVTGGRTPGWLFLSYDLDSGDITAVRRVAKDDPQWADWNQFVYEQVERCFADPTSIPNERVYAFSFNKLESIPFLNGETNNHYIDFVSKSVPVYQLGILECGYTKNIGIEPTRLRLDERNYDRYSEYVCGLRTECDMALFKYTVQADSENYELLYDLVARYTDLPDITSSQIEFLNKQPTGLRVFSVLEELFDSSEYVVQNFNKDNYESLVYLPAVERKGIHYLKAELEKFDIATGRKAVDDPDKDKKVLELTLYIRGYEIRPGWETSGPDREWFSACVERLTDAENIAREFRNFAYAPALTRCQLQYLIRMGTSAATLYNSGIMGDVIMETPYFKNYFGLDMAGAKDRKLEYLDRIVVDSARMVVQSSLAWLHEVVGSGDESEQVRQMAVEKMPEVEIYLKLIDESIARFNMPALKDSDSDRLAALRRVFEEVSAYYAARSYIDNDGQTGTHRVDEVLSMLTACDTDTALSEKMVRLLLDYVDKLPVSFLASCLKTISALPYGQLHANIDNMTTTDAKAEELTVMQKLSLSVQYREIQDKLGGMQEELVDKERTERRIQNEINNLYDRINGYKADIDRIKRLLDCPPSNKTIEQP